MRKKKIVVLAFSGGLDTSFCIPHLKENYGYEVISVTVDTGGFTRDDLDAIARRARRLGVLEHRVVDGRQEVFDRYASYLIKGNILRGGVYPLSVSAERVVQAEMVVRVARQVGAVALAHGSTGAGNDQVRFDLAFQVLLPETPCLTPVRDLGLSRAEEYEFLKARGVDIETSVRDYSINTGLWGATIGGQETHDTWKEIPDEVFNRASGETPVKGREYVEIRFEGGVPAGLDGSTMSGVDLVEVLGKRCRHFGIGRGVHIGDTVIGIKGRIAFEAGAAIVLIDAHRELEKVTTTQWQRFWKDHLGEFYGKMLHEGQVFDPVMRDIEALLDRSQERVNGDVRVRLERERFQVVGVRSPHTMIRARSGVYGEVPELWTGPDVKGFSTIVGIPSLLHTEAGKEKKEKRDRREREKEKES